MKNWNLYRLLLPLVSSKGGVQETDLPPAQAQAAETILRRRRCQGATLCLFDESGVTGRLAFGLARMDGTPAGIDTVYRTASVSKFVTALGALKLAEQGVLSLDADVNVYLSFPLRHPLAPDTPITLRMLLSHTAGIHDGDAYNTGIAKGALLSDILAGDSFAAHAPGTIWEYSNLGAGIAGAVLEAAAGEDFETLMQRTVFAPLGVAATYYPQKAGQTLADAWRILPPAKAPNFDAAKRQARPLPLPTVNAERHYALAHGNLCASAPELCKLAVAGMTPGFLRAETLSEMRREIAPFGERADNLSEGVGAFILRDSRLCPRPLYGHQGMAYGAVHGLFFDPETKRGLALLTSAAGEARRGVLADLNADMIRLFLGGK